MVTLMIILLENLLELYLYNEYMIYYSLLEYNATKIPYYLEDIESNTNIDKMKHLTNLEIINNIYNKSNYDKLKQQKIHTTLFSKIKHQHKFFNNIDTQIINIYRKTIDAVKNDLRSLNRYSNKYKGSFNLVAYNTLMDNTGKLWLIELIGDQNFTGVTFKYWG